MKVFFWQISVTPHMFHLADSLSGLGVDVTYVAAEYVSVDREEMGWHAPSPKRKLKLIVESDWKNISAIVNAAPPEAVHLVQGLRGNGGISRISALLRKLGNKQYVLIEGVDQRGLKGVFRRFLYAFYILRDDWVSGYLAIGALTPSWLARCGANPEKIFRFRYYLPFPEELDRTSLESPRAFRFIFVGQIIKRKRVDLLISALAYVTDLDFELLVVGSGVEEKLLKDKAKYTLGERVTWLGTLPMTEVARELALADCLVLPSDHDGWGAVVSEALMVGTQVVCSSACGSSEVVRGSGSGSVFRAGDVCSLVCALRSVLLRGRLTDQERSEISDWAYELSDEFGALHLRDLILKAQSR